MPSEQLDKGLDGSEPLSPVPPPEPPLGRP